MLCCSSATGVWHQLTKCCVFWKLTKTSIFVPRRRTIFKTAVNLNACWERTGLIPTSFLLPRPACVQAAAAVRRIEALGGKQSTLDCDIHRILHGFVESTATFLYSAVEIRCETRCWNYAHVWSSNAATSGLNVIMLDVWKETVSLSSNSRWIKRINHGWPNCGAACGSLSFPKNYIFVFYFDCKV